MRYVFTSSDQIPENSIFSRLNNRVKAEKPENRHVGKIDLMWNLFYIWPGKSPRLQQIRSAVQRVDNRRNIQGHLPERAEFLTTASYYEHVMPLVLARSRFISMLQPSSFLLGVHMALSRIALKTPETINETTRQSASVQARR